MEIIIVGGTSNQEITQAALAALAQAGISVKITEVESIKVAVNLSGGNFQEAVANVPVGLQIVDYDNLDSDEGYQEWKRVKSSLPIEAT